MTSIETSKIAGWELLRERFPWPEQKPACKSIHWSLDYGGRGLVTRLIRERRLKVVLEIGVFLGGSVRQWLAASPDVVVIAVDRWSIPPEQNDFVLRKSSEEVRRVLRDPELFYQAFLSTLWDERDRVVPVRGESIDMLHELHALGVRPDLVYLDADKEGGEIALCEKLFPGLLISGDDWYWGADQGLPIRRPVREFCRANGRHLKQVAMTWVIDVQPATLAERCRLLYYLPHEIVLSCYAAYHWLRGKLRSEGKQ